MKLPDMPLAARVRGGTVRLCVAYHSLIRLHTDYGFRARASSCRSCCWLHPPARLRARRTSRAPYRLCRLTRASVTPSISLYQRGASVQLQPEPDADPLAIERMRVVLYLEGPIARATPDTRPNSARPTMQQVNRQFAPQVLAGSTRLVSEHGPDLSQRLFAVEAEEL